MTGRGSKWLDNDLQSVSFMRRMDKDPTGGRKTRCHVLNPFIRLNVRVGSRRRTAIACRRNWLHNARSHFLR